MSKTKLILDTARDLRQLAASIEALADAMAGAETSQPDTPIPANAPAKPIPIENVRAVLADKSQAGKQPEVKALLTRFGANRLTDIDPVHYADLIKAAEAL